jgi:hypothetical protein
MPWTVAHAAAVLPLRRVRALPFPALVAGSMAPDLGYYLGHFELTGPAHGLFPGLLLSIPAGLAMLAAWKLLGPSACAAMPSPIGDALATSFERKLPRSASGVALLCLALAIGALTHIAWDACTHARGWFVYRTPFMRVPVELWGWYELPRYRLLQHLSTVFGCCALLLAWRRSSRGIEWGQVWRREAERLRLALLLALGLLAACASGLLLDFDPGLRVEDRLFRYALVAPLCFAAMLCTAGLALRRADRA